MLVFPDADHNEIGLVPSGAPFEHISVVRHFTREHFVKETLDGSTNWLPAVIFGQSPDLTVEMFCVEHHGLPINARPFYRFRGRPLSHRNIVAPQNSAGTAAHDKATSTIFDKLFNKVRWIETQMTFSNPVSTIYEQSHLVIVGVRIGNDLIGEAAHHRMTVLTSVDGCNGPEVLLPPSQNSEPQTHLEMPLKSFLSSIEFTNDLEEKAKGPKSSANPNRDDFGNAGVGHADNPDRSRTHPASDRRKECPSAHGRVSEAARLPGNDEVSAGTTPSPAAREVGCVVPPQADVSFDLWESSICGLNPACFSRAPVKNARHRRVDHSLFVPRRSSLECAGNGCYYRLHLLDRAGGLHGVQHPFDRPKSLSWGECVSITHPSTKCYQK